MAIKDLIVRGSMWAYRKCEIKRVLDDGTYESDWFDITPYVSTWGTIQTSMLDNIYANQFQIEDVQMVFNNSNREFSTEEEPASLFYTFKQRFRTKFKLQIGLYDEDQTETLGRTFYGILLKQPVTRDNHQITFNIAHILKVLQLYPADGVAVTASTTAGMIDRLVKKTENSVRLFDRFFEGVNDAAKYQIDATGAYTLSQPVISDTETVWDAIKRYSSYQDSFPYINQDGNFIWEDRSATVAIQWYFNGPGNFYDNSFGVNLRDGVTEVEDINNQFSRVALNYDAGTYTKTVNWTPGDGSDTDKYGQVTFAEWPSGTDELTLSEATTIGDAFNAEYAELKRRWMLPATFIPHLNVKDRIEINYIGEQQESNSFRVDVSGLAPAGDRDAAGFDRLGDFSGSLKIKSQEAVIIRVVVNMDNFYTAFEAKEIT